MTERVWVIKAMAWTDAGMIQIRDGNNWVDLRPELAKRAIGKEAAVPLGHERAGKHIQNTRQYYGGGLPSLEKCIRLDDETESVLEVEKSRPEEPHHHVVLHSAADPMFERVDRGPGYTGTIKTHGPDVAA